MKKNYIRVFLLMGIIILALGAFSYLTREKDNKGKNSQNYENEIMEKDSLARKEAKKITSSATDKGKVPSKVQKKIIKSINEIYSIIGKDGDLSQKNKIALSYKTAVLFYVNDKISEHKSNPKYTEKFLDNKVYKAIMQLHNFFADSNEDSIKKEDVIKILGNKDYQSFISDNAFREYINLLKKKYE